MVQVVGGGGEKSPPSTPASQPSAAFLCLSWRTLLLPEAASSLCRLDENAEGQTGLSAPCEPSLGLHALGVKMLG